MVLHNNGEIFVIPHGYAGRIWNNEVIMGVEEACKRKDPPYLNI